jgi:hypothetical protein
MPDVTLVLGGVTFSDLEIPAEIEGGGAQAMQVHKLLGGARVIDALGRDDEALEWSGRFQGGDAEGRAQTLDQIRIAGQPVLLTWGSRSYTVVVASFRWKWQRFYQILYSISCVVQDDGTTAPASSNATTDDLVGGDMDSIADITPNLTDSTVAPAISGLSSAIAALGTLQGASLTALGPIATAAQTATTVLVASNTTTDLGILTDTGSVAGVIAGQFPTISVTAFTAQSALINEEWQAQEAYSLVKRVATNIAQATG